MTKRLRDESKEEYDEMHEFESPPKKQKTDGELFYVVSTERENNQVMVHITFKMSCAAIF